MKSECVVDADEFDKDLVCGEVARGEAEAFKHFPELAVFWSGVSGWRWRW